MINIFNHIRKFFGGKSSQNPPENPPSAAPSPKRNVGGGRPKIQFDIAAAYRLHYDKHMSYSALARKLGISKDTISARCQEMHAQLEAERSRREAEAAAEKVKAQAQAARDRAARDAQAAREAASRAQQARRDAEYRAAHPVPPVQPKPPIIPPPVSGPVYPVPVPAPITNYDGLVNYYAMHGSPDDKTDPARLAEYKNRIDTTRFFLVRGADNVKFGTGSEQFVIGIESWHKEYHDLDEFKNAKRIWVVIDPREDNKIFLYSLCQDIWIREKCVVIRSTVFDAVRARWQWFQQCLSRFSNHPWNYERECAAIEDANFERENKFIPIPQPNHVRELEALLAPLPEPERMSPFGGSIGDPYGGGYRTFPDGSPMPPQQGSNDVPAPRDTGECRPAGSY